MAKKKPRHSHRNPIYKAYIGVRHTADPTGLPESAMRGDLCSLMFLSGEWLVRAFEESGEGITANTFPTLGAAADFVQAIYGATALVVLTREVGLEEMVPQHSRVLFEKPVTTWS